MLLEPEEPHNPAQRETLDIPQSLRDACDQRDAQRCRVCGKWLGDARALHHIRFGGDRQGMGGRRQHDLDNLITVCWMWGGNCHDLVHARKSLYLPLLEELAVRPGVTAFQLRRWQALEQMALPVVGGWRRTTSWNVPLN